MSEIDYEELSKNLDDLGKRSVELIRGILSNEKIYPHAIIYRVKSKSSAENKISKSPDKYGSISELHDMLGIRVITHLSSEVGSVVNILKENFSVDHNRSKNKSEILDAEKFGYLSVHLIAGLNEKRQGLPEWGRFSDIEFEIQVRTVLQHAWAEIEHDLGYKSPHGTIAKNYRRRFARLASLLEIADEEFDKLSDELLARENKIKEELEISNKTPITLKSIRNLAISEPLIKSIDDRVASALSLNLRPADSVEYYKVRATELQRVGFENVEQVVSYAKPIQNKISDFIVSWFDSGDDWNEFDYISNGISLFYIYLIKEVELLGHHFNSAPGSADDGEDPSNANHRFLALYDKIFR